MRLRVWLGAVRKHWVVWLGLAGVALLVAAVDPRKVASAWVGADAGLIGMMLPVVFLLYFGHGLAWWIALRGVGAEVGWRQAVRVTFISQAFDLLPGGDLWRVPIIRSEGTRSLNSGRVAASVIFDDLVYFFVLTMAAVPAALIEPAIRLPLALALIPQLVIFACLLQPSLYAALAGRIATWRIARRFHESLLVLGPAFRQLVRVKILVPVLLLDGVCVGLATTLYWLAVNAVHTNNLSVSQIVFTYAVGQVVSGLSVVPAALGIYEGVMTGLMALQGAAPASATAAILLYRLVNDFLMALVGLGVAVGVDRGYLRAWPRGSPAVMPLNPVADWV